MLKSFLFIAKKIPLFAFTLIRADDVSILFGIITFTLPIFGTSSARVIGKVAPPSVDIEIITSLSPIGFISVLATSHLIDSTAPPLTK